MTDVLADLDGLLQTGKKFLLGKWISDAKSWGVTEGVCEMLVSVYLIENDWITSFDAICQNIGEITIRVERQKPNYAMGAKRRNFGLRCQTVGRRGW